jgi:hypothetical protein
MQDQSSAHALGSIDKSLGCSVGELELRRCMRLQEYLTRRTIYDLPWSTPAHVPTPQSRPSYHLPPISWPPHKSKAADDPAYTYENS